MQVPIYFQFYFHFFTCSTTKLSSVIFSSFLNLWVDPKLWNSKIIQKTSTFILSYTTVVFK